MAKEKSTLNTRKGPDFFEYLPKDLFKASAFVDFLTFLATSKPCLRTKVINRTSLPSFYSLCHYYNFYYYIDTTDHLFLSKSKEDLRKAIFWDLHTDPHAYQFGELLGYPKCCCEYIAGYEESEIDELCNKISLYNYKGIFELINPKYYLLGKGFICHIPCSVNCKYSLSIAIENLRFVIRHRESSLFTPWHWALKFQTYL